mmetsp:Transcript_83738/g.251018  ORF Transcript_83738/g.251018 Transcript_83738/m.251018 type:complete len:215 (-) Transcript_83738:77-721(-)
MSSSASSSPATRARRAASSSLPIGHIRPPAADVVAAASASSRPATRSRRAASSSSPSIRRSRGSSSSATSVISPSTRARQRSVLSGLRAVLCVSFDGEGHQAVAISGPPHRASAFAAELGISTPFQAPSMALLSLSPSSPMGCVIGATSSSPSSSAKLLVNPGSEWATFRYLCSSFDLNSPSAYPPPSMSESSNSSSSSSGEENQLEEPDAPSW